MAAIRESAVPARNGPFCGPAAGSPLECGTVVADRFVLRAHLGRSRFGQVYKALDRKWSDPQLGLEQYVALHVLDERMRAQTRLLRKLESSYLQTHLWAHPNIVRFRGFGADRGTYYLSTDLLEGRTLRRVLDEIRPNPLSLDTALSLLQPVSDALTYAHDRSAVHGDIRPETIFVATDRTVKVLDLLPASSARTTPFFIEDTMPNGLFNPDLRDDVYGLACLAYELLTGVHPFKGATALETLNDGVTPVPITRLAPDRWEALAGGLALRRAERTPSVAELLAQLRGDRRAQRTRTRARAARTTAASRDQHFAPDDDVFLIGENPRPVSPRRDAATARDDAPIRAERAVPRETGPDRAPDYAAFRAEQLREPWQPTEPFIAPLDMQAYRRDVRRRRARRGSGSPVRAVVWLLSFGIAATLVVTAYLAYGPFQAQVRQTIATAASAVGLEALDALDAPVVTRMPESTVSVAPDPIVPVMLDAGASESSAMVPATIESGSGAAAEESSTESATDAAEGVAPTVPARIEPAEQVVTVSESQAAAAVVIHRRGGSLEPASMVWWTSDGTAVAGEDYADLGLQLVHFAAGQDTYTILVPIVADSVVEDPESFYVNVTVGDVTTRPLTPDHRVEVVILDDDR
jgi:serine/threonine protein kinase